VDRCSGGPDIGRVMLGAVGHRARQRLLGSVSAIDRNGLRHSAFGAAADSALLGSVEKSRSGVAAGVLNSSRQTGSVLGVALFGSLIGQTNDFISGVRAALAISTLLLVSAATAIRERATNEGADQDTSDFHCRRRIWVINYMPSRSSKVRSYPNIRHRLTRPSEETIRLDRIFG
jgi:hypothetical protein